MNFKFRVSAIALTITTIVQLTLPVKSQQTTQFKPLNGVKIGNIQYLKSETSPDAKLERAILRDYLTDYNETNPENYVRYYYNRLDLNGDNQPEIIVYLVGSYVCGSGGCNALIYTPKGQDYQLLSQHTLVNPPILVTPQRNSGWKNLVFLTSGGGAKPEYNLMRFNGRTYPLNPSVQPAVPANSTLTGIGLFADSLSNPGRRLKPKN
ncbi:hypothetical protein ACE1CI_13075 [Aerosakkonemataceae cyanobacterium BLCC-F50]|uniref:Uncharacterized protein n=1 Tax=Floridaenema flaviceps BLCC-F50 TaxID=3153642 RepID=A0ABV4XRD3_9CYAN